MASMYSLNRWLITVTPKQPFIDWVNRNDPEHQLSAEEVREDPTGYLVPEYVYLSDREKVIEECYDLLFEEELYAWYTDETMWPQQRDLKMFREWFEVNFQSLVFDLVPEIPLYDLGAEPDSDESVDEEQLDSNGHGH
jgi:hypothetical protein